MAALGAGWKGLATGLDDRRNVVLIVVDQLRADHLGCYGADVSTPNIDALSAAGVRFDSAFPEAMPTVPARRAIMTGRRVFPFLGWQPWEGLGSTPGWEPIMPGTPTLATELGARGYHTSYVTDNPFLAYAEVFQPFRDSFDEFLRIPGQTRLDQAPEGIDAELARRLLPASHADDPEHVRGMSEYLYANGARRGGLGIVEEETTTARTFAAAAWSLRRNVNRRPQLLIVDNFDPHEPWAVPEHYLERYRRPGEEPLPLGDIGYTPRDALTPGELARLRTTYSAATTMVDRWVGHLLDAIEYLNLADDTAVMLVSDHGMHLGERDWVGKSAWRLQHEQIQVPLILRDPDGRGAGTSSDWFASTHDIAPTLLALAGLPPSRAFEGEDLSPILEGRQPARPRPFAYGGYSNNYFVRDHRWAMISNNRANGSMLYDLRADPLERRDISKANPDVVWRYRERMFAEIGAPPPFYSPEQIEARALPASAMPG